MVEYTIRYILIKVYIRFDRVSVGDMRQMHTRNCRQATLTRANRMSFHACVLPVLFCLLGIMLRMHCGNDVTCNKLRWLTFSFYFFTRVVHRLNSFILFDSSFQRYK